jgi:hypothetical protein
VAAIGDLIIICIVGFLIIAALSPVLAKTPATPPFARRPRNRVDKITRKLHLLP